MPDLVDWHHNLQVCADTCFLLSLYFLFFCSLCFLLRCGGIDAEVYSGISKNLIGILWSIGTPKRNDSESLWVKARGTAFHSLSHYKVMLRFFVPCVLIFLFLVRNPVSIVCIFFNNECFTGLTYSRCHS